MKLSFIFVAAVALAFTAGLVVANPAVPDPGHSWSQIEPDYATIVAGLNAQGGIAADTALVADDSDTLDGIDSTELCKTSGEDCPAAGTVGHNNCQWIDVALEQNTPINTICPAGQYVAGVRTLLAVSTQVAHLLEKIYCCDLY